MFLNKSLVKHSNVLFRTVPIFWELIYFSAGALSPALKSQSAGVLESQSAGVLKFGFLGFDVFLAFCAFSALGIFLAFVAFLELGAFLAV